MKPRPDLEQRRDTTPNPRLARSRLGNPAQNFQERALPRPVPPNQPDHLPRLNIERNIAQSPEFVSRSRGGRSLGVERRVPNTFQHVSVSAFQLFRTEPRKKRLRFLAERLRIENSEFVFLREVLD